MIVETKYIVYRIQDISSMEYVKENEDLYIYYGENRAITVYFPEAKIVFEKNEEQWKDFILYLGELNVEEV